MKIYELIRSYWFKAETQKEYGRNWELLKYELGKFLRKFGADLAKEKRATEDDIIVQLAALSQQEALTDEEREKYTKLQTRLDDIYKTKAKGAYIRSRAKWLEEGEQNSAYFFRLEKSKGLLATIDQLKVDDKIINDPRDIATLCYNFYSNLYTSNYCDATASSFIDSVS